MFSDESYFRENKFFSVFGCIPNNDPENILQYCAKDRAEKAGGEACIFGKWFTEKLGVNHFPNFNKRLFS